MLAIQKFLRSQPSALALEKAEKLWALDIQETENLALLNYSMISSPRGVQEVDECRGLILEKSSWDVVAMPFFRFYNEAEGPAAKIKLEGSTLQEKLDGSLMTLFFYGGKWHVSTRGRIFADGGVNSLTAAETFHDLFWATVRETMEGKFHNPDKAEFPPNLTMTFELTSPSNRIITPYEKAELTLLLARDKEASHRELFPNELEDLRNFLGVKRPKEYNFADREQIQELMSKLGKLDEGFVLVNYSEQVNGNFERVKIKNPSYLAASKFQKGFGPLQALELCFLGETEEFMSYFPEHKDLLTRCADGREELEKKLDLEFSHIINTVGQSDRKAFAAIACRSVLPSIMFSLLDRKATTAKEALNNYVIGNSGVVSSNKIKILWNIIEGEERP